MPGQHFICYFQNDEIKVCQKLLIGLESAYQQLIQELGIKLEKTIAVYLTPSQQIFDALVGRYAPHWSDAIAVPTKNIIVLKSPTWSTPPHELLSIATHELVHMLLHQMLKGQAIPRWFEEGLAVYYSGEKRYASSSLVSRALLTGSLLSLDEIDHVLEFRADVAQLAYQQSYLAVVFLMKNYGAAAMRQIINHLAIGEPFDDALVHNIGLDRWEFEQAWLKYIQHQYRWHFLVDFDSYLWIFVLLLFLAGYMLMRRRNRRILEQWDTEDERLVN
ncbi:MAG: peptidase MA family metallohydrolase [candidate division KSB1 bacterium]|nr:peptidase MA family metallohydrolase [candidate division KSB1 bacterium]MDZ7335483.1 peptidase MA family metallohydrolase [candidate division KSB1 bacterium]MDZ7357642.1 peptidase MA family metallohydrolase [candidate division KSB1 bacterium]MDZ7377233.1 peptidase MA family metallohydrolase [candidate division KSB1 bacterium]MDZ7399214.1 peptidase MA family metallohydrolase [candidate division KSB1 bacterium]